MITVDFFGGSDLSHKKRRIIIHRRHGRATRENGSAFRRQRRRRLVASTRRARWNGASSSSSSSRVHLTRRSSLFLYPSLSSCVECECGRNRRRFLSLSFSRCVCRCDRRRLLCVRASLASDRVAHHSRSLSSLSISPPYRIVLRLNRNRRPAAIKRRRRRTKGAKRTSKTSLCRANTKTCKRKC